MDKELIGTSEVKRVLAITDFLNPHINEKDKEPFYDGHIYVYSDKSKSNEYYKGRIPVQVKSEEVDDPYITETKYSIRTSDLRAYLEDDGAVYVVVLISHDARSTKIFYVDLLPFKIERFLNKAGKNITKRVLLKSFPTEKKEIEDWAFRFLVRRKSQKSRSQLKAPKLSQLVLNVNIIEYKAPFKTSSSTIRTINNLVSQEKHIYAVTDDGLNLPFDYCDTTMSPPHFTRINRNICIGDEVYFEYYYIKHSKDETIINFGKNLSIISEKIPDNVLYKRTFCFQISGTLNDRISDLTFIYNFALQRCIMVAGVTLDFTSADVVTDTINVEKAKKALNYNKHIRQILDSAGVLGDVDIDKYTQEDFTLLESLSPSLIDNKAVYCPADEYKKLQNSDVIVMTSTNLRLALLATRTDSDMFIFRSLFRERVRVYTIVDGREYFTSQYGILTPENYVVISNIDYLEIKESILEPPLSKVHWEQTNAMLLNILIAYDTNPHNKDELIDLAKFIAQWLLDNSDEESKHLAITNSLQIKQRERALTKEEISNLHLIIETSKNDIILFGVYVLLGDRASAYRHFELFTEKEKEQFMIYPIYSLYEKL
jgi:hypothetical protein